MLAPPLSRSERVHIGILFVLKSFSLSLSNPPPLMECATVAAWVYIRHVRFRACRSGTLEVLSLLVSIPKTAMGKVEMTWRPTNRTKKKKKTQVTSNPSMKVCLFETLCSGPGNNVQAEHHTTAMPHQTPRTGLPNLNPIWTSKHWKDRLQAPYNEKCCAVKKGLRMHCLHVI